MKRLLALAALLLTTVCTTFAQQSTGAVAPSWWTDFSITPFGVLNHPNITDKPIYGAGLDVGYNLNPTVSLHVANLAYESTVPPSSAKTEHGRASAQRAWGGPAIDETSLFVRADLVRYSQERLVLYAIGGGDRSWDHSDWGFSAGAGLELRLSKNFSIGADARVRAWFKESKDLPVRGFVSFRF